MQAFKRTVDIELNKGANWPQNCTMHTNQRIKISEKRFFLLGFVFRSPLVVVSSGKVSPFNESRSLSNVRNDTKVTEEMKTQQKGGI